MQAGIPPPGGDSGTQPPTFSASGDDQSIDRYRQVNRYIDIIEDR